MVDKWKDRGLLWKSWSSSSFMGQTFLLKKWNWWVDWKGPSKIGITSADWRGNKKTEGNWTEIEHISFLYTLAFYYQVCFLEEG